MRNIKAIYFKMRPFTTGEVIIKKIALKACFSKN